MPFPLLALKALRENLGAKELCLHGTGWPKPQHFPAGKRESRGRFPSGLSRRGVNFGWGVWMRVWGGLAIGVSVLLSGCASFTHSTLVDCTREAALSRGAKDGAAGRKIHLQFTRACTSATRELAAAAYREGFESSRPKRKPGLTALKEIAEDEELADSESLLPLPSPMRAPSAISWVCEVEASSKVFTGVGITQTQALGSARANCGSHFQASYCTKSDCRQNM
jgi:hypothetical protein